MLALIAWLTLTSKIEKNHNINGINKISRIDKIKSNKVNKKCFLFLVV